MQNRKFQRLRIVAGVTLLTLAVGAEARAPHRGHVMSKAKTTALAGQIGGTWTQNPQVPDAGGVYELSGNGTVAPLGAARGTGSLGSPGLTAQGRTSGTFTLTSPQGTLILALSGPAQPGFSAPPSSLTYTVTGGTGAYAGVHGSGTAQLAMTPQRRPATVPGRMTPHFIVAAMFTLTFGGAPTARG